MIELLVFVLAAIGMSHILVDGSIFICNPLPFRLAKGPSLLLSSSLSARAIRSLSAAKRLHAGAAAA
jgi:hypothetical protein